MKGQKKDVCADLEKAQKKKSVGKWLKERKNKKETKNELNKRTNGNLN